MCNKNSHHNNLISALTTHYFTQNMPKEKQHSDLTTEQGFHNRIPDHEERSGRLFRTSVLQLSVDYLSLKSGVCQW